MGRDVKNSIIFSNNLCIVCSGNILSLRGELKYFIYTSTVNQWVIFLFGYDSQCICHNYCQYNL